MKTKTYFIFPVLAAFVLVMAGCGSGSGGGATGDLTDYGAHLEDVAWVDLRTEVWTVINIPAAGGGKGNFKSGKSYAAGPLENADVWVISAAGRIIRLEAQGSGLYSGKILLSASESFAIYGKLGDIVVENLFPSPMIANRKYDAGFTNAETTAYVEIVKLDLGAAGWTAGTLADVCANLYSGITNTDWNELKNSVVSGIAPFDDIVAAYGAVLGEADRRGESNSLQLYASGTHPYGTPIEYEDAGDAVAAAALPVYSVDKADIRNVFGTFINAYASKDQSALLSLLPSNYLFNGREKGEEVEKIGILWRDTSSIFIAADLSDIDIFDNTATAYATVNRTWTTFAETSERRERWSVRFEKVMNEWKFVGNQLYAGINAGITTRKIIYGDSTTETKYYLRFGVEGSRFNTIDDVTVTGSKIIGELKLTEDADLWWTGEYEIDEIDLPNPLETPYPYIYDIVAEYHSDALGTVTYQVMLGEDNVVDPAAAPSILSPSLPIVRPTNNLINVTYGNIPTDYPFPANIKVSASQDEDWEVKEYDKENVPYNYNTMSIPTGTVITGDYWIDILVEDSNYNAIELKREYYLDKGPVVVYDELDGILSRVIYVGYTLYDVVDNDNVSLIVEYNDGEHGWRQAVMAAGGDGRTGLSASLAGEHHYYTWNCWVDLGATPLQTDIQVRITPYDTTSTGEVTYSPYFMVDNYSVTFISVLTPTAAQSRNIDIAYNIFDGDYDFVDVEVEYSIDGVNWLAAREGDSGTSDGLTYLSSDPSGAPHVFEWNSTVDLGVTLFETMQIRVTPTNDGFGEPSGRFTVDNSNAPYISGSRFDTIPPYQFEIDFFFTIVDSTSDPIDIELLFSKDNGLNWNTATITADSPDKFNNLTSSPNGREHHIRWNAWYDLGAGSFPACRFAIYPEDADGPGAEYKTSPFYVDNPYAPVVESIGLPEEYDGEAGIGEVFTFTFTVSDVERDPCSVFIEYATDAGAPNWQPMTAFADETEGLATAMENEGGVTHSITWSSRTDIPFGDFSTAVIRVTPTDDVTGKEGTSLSLIYHLYNPMFQVVGDMGTARWLHASTLLQDGRILTSGGYSGNESRGRYGAITNTAEFFDPVTKEWSSDNAMSYSRFEHYLFTTPNGYAIAIGGYGNTSYSGGRYQIERYTPNPDGESKGMWSYVRGIPGANQYSTYVSCQLRDGQILCQYNYKNSYSDQYSYIRSFVYNGDTNGYTYYNSYISYQYYNGYTSWGQIHGRLLPILDGNYNALKIGGQHYRYTYAWSGSTYLYYYNYCDGYYCRRYNYTTSWSSTPVQPGAGQDGQNFLAGASLDDGTGRILWTGGGHHRRYHNRGGFYKYAQIFDPAANSFTELNLAGGSRNWVGQHAACTIDGGDKVFICGGVDERSIRDGYNMTAEIYMNDVDNTMKLTSEWAGGGDLPEDYTTVFHNTCLMADGKVLIFGGKWRSSNPDPREGEIHKTAVIFYPPEFE